MINRRDSTYRLQTTFTQARPQLRIDQFCDSPLITTHDSFWPQKRDHSPGRCLGTVTTKLHLIILINDNRNLNEFDFTLSVCTVAVFTVRLHVMQRTVFPRPFCPSVRLSVCPSDKRVHCDKTKKKLVPHSYTTRKSIHHSYLKRIVGVGRPLVPGILGQTYPM